MSKAHLAVVGERPVTTTTTITHYYYYYNVLQPNGVTFINFTRHRLVSVWRQWKIKLRERERVRQRERERRSFGTNVTRPRKQTVRRASHEVSAVRRCVSSVDLGPFDVTFSSPCHSVVTTFSSLCHSVVTTFSSLCHFSSLKEQVSARLSKITKTASRLTDWQTCPGPPGTLLRKQSDAWRSSL